MRSFVFFLVMIAIGASFGIATIPWADRLSSKINAEKSYLYVLIWACCWPYLILMLMWVGLKAYQKAWWDYADKKQEARFKKRRDY